MNDKRLGLPPPAKSGETDEERKERLAAVNRLLQDVFATVVEQVGPDEAKRIWRTVLEGQKAGRGRPRRSQLSGWETWLLWMYDGLKKDDPNPETIVRFLAWSLCERAREEARQKGSRVVLHSSNALEKRLRRLLKDRKEGRLIPDDPNDEFPIYTIRRPSRGQ